MKKRKKMKLQLPHHRYHRKWKASEWKKKQIRKGASKQVTINQKKLLEEI